MRFRFLQTGRERDEVQRGQVLERIDAWWVAFGEKRDELNAYFASNEQWDLPAWMHETLNLVEPRLMWEFGPGSNGGHRLAVTPEVERQVRPLVDTLLERCPGYDGWEFCSYRPPESLDVARAMLESRELAPIDKTMVVVTPNEDCLVDLSFYSKRYKGREDPDAGNSVWVASEVILGEQMIDVWIGDISVNKGTGKREGAKSLSEMQRAVDEAVAHVQAGLPARPLWQSIDGMAGAVWKLEPIERDEYPRQLDLFVGRSSHQAMWEAAHGDGIFDSRRFSRHGELFCYVKTDGSVDLSGEKFEAKGEMEDAIAAELTKREIGAVVGGGTGLRYSYIDLALSDPDKGIQAVVDVMRDGNMVKETWIQFFDDRYASEWVGVWDESPLPPGMSE